MVVDAQFYVGLKGLPYLKKEHHLGYFTQIQMALGSSATEKYYVVVYIYMGLIVWEANFYKKIFYWPDCKIEWLNDMFLHETG